MTPSVSCLIEAEGLLAIAFVGNDGRRSTLVEPFTQFGTVVGFVAEQLLGRLCATNEARRRWTIVTIAAGQEDGKKTAFSICDCMDFRIAPAA